MQCPDYVHKLNNIAGYWSSSTPSGCSYEFFLSTTETPFDVALKTGRIHDGEKITNLFYWDLDGYGAIVLHLLNAICPIRPLIEGDVIGVMKIESTDGFKKKSTWTMSFDLEKKGFFQGEVVEIYDRKDIVVSKIPQGEFYLLQHENFEEASVGSFCNGILSLKLFDLGAPVDFSASLCGDTLSDISLSNATCGEIFTTQAIRVEGEGYKEIPVKKWIDQVKLVASVNEKLVIYYEIHSQVHLPSDIHRDRVDVEGCEKIHKKSLIFSLVSEFVPGPRISVSDIFYSRVKIDFNFYWMLGTSGGNEIIFTSETEGVVRYTDLFEDRHSAFRHFTWYQQDDGSVILSVPDFGDIIIKFIKVVSGGHQALMSYSDKGNLHWRCPQVHHWLRDNTPAITDRDFPGHYRFISDNGWLQIDLILHKDGTVTSVPEALVSGYWFQDTNGDIVSYECIDEVGNVSANYDDCYAAFNNLSKGVFTHIRRLHFLNKEDNIFQLKYDAALYGARFGIDGDNYYTVAWTYMWTRIGDAPE